MGGTSCNIVEARPSLNVLSLRSWSLNAGTVCYVAIVPLGCLTFSLILPVSKVRRSATFSIAVCGSIDANKDA